MRGVGQDCRGGACAAPSITKTIAELNSRKLATHSMEAACRRVASGTVKPKLRNAVDPIARDVDALPGFRHALLLLSLYRG